MTSTCSAAAAALPAPLPALIDPLPRRGFLRQLASLPLIGGGLSIIGRPTAVAEPVTFDMLQAYKNWLHHEHRCLSHELAEHPRMVEWYRGTHRDRFDQIERLFCFIDVGESAGWHWDKGRPKPSTRAALVMSTVGCDWRGD